MYSFHSILVVTDLVQLYTKLVTTNMEHREYGTLNNENHFVMMLLTPYHNVQHFRNINMVKLWPLFFVKHNAKD
jgi:hypothetical protein